MCARRRLIFARSLGFFLPLSSLSLSRAPSLSSFRLLDSVVVVGCSEERDAERREKANLCGRSGRRCCIFVTAIRSLAVSSAAERLDLNLRYGCHKEPHTKQHTRSDHWPLLLLLPQPSGPASMAIAAAIGWRVIPIFCLHLSLSLCLGHTHPHTHTHRQNSPAASGFGLQSCACVPVFSYGKWLRKTSSGASPL